MHCYAAGWYFVSTYFFFVAIEENQVYLGRLIGEQAEDTVESVISS